ncbi:MAG: hypothetical protein AB8C84_06805 [Oligoflexales bacterium]
MIDIKLSKQSPAERFPTWASGTLQFSVHEAPVCIQLPKTHPSSHNFLARRIGLLSGQKSLSVFQKSSLSLENSEQAHILEDGVIQFTKKGHYSLKFKGQIPLPLFLAEYENLAYLNYYPIILEDCKNHRFSKNIKTQIKIKIPKNLHLAGSNAEYQNGFYYLKSWQTHIPMALAVAPWERHQSFTVYGPLTLWTQSPTQDISTAQSAMVQHSKTFGAYPFSSLDIIEASGGQGHIIKGHVLLDTPRKKTLRNAQSEYMNLHNWALVTLMAQQWVGVSVFLHHPNDTWLFEGLIEYATARALENMGHKSSLWNTWKKPWNPVSLNYQDIQNLGTTWLSSHVPYSQLTKDDYTSRLPYKRQSPLIYLRHAAAMKHCAAAASESQLLNSLHRIMQKFKGSTFTPQEFRSELLSDLPYLKHQVDRWWTTRSWPDYELLSFHTQPTKSQQWITMLRMVDHGGFNTPIPVRLSNAQNDYFTTVVQQKSGQPIEILTTFEPTTAEIDPFYKTFDIDRFNNSNKNPGISAFPGSAKTLSDKDYTLIWFPYFLRRHGEPMSVGIITSLYRYLTHGLTMYSEWQNENKTLSSQLVYQSNIFQHTTHLTAHLSKDHYGDSLALLQLKREIPIPAGLSPKIGSIIRHRSNKGGLNSHETFALSAETHYQGLLEVFQQTEWETSLPGIYNYSRNKIMLHIHTPTTYPIQWSGRWIHGSTSYSKAPETALWTPQKQTDGAIRIDEQNLDSSNKIMTISQELSIPFPIPLPSSAFLLGGRARLRAFYDYGHSYAPEHIYSASGLIMNLPIGGDVTGAGPVSLSGLSATLVLHTRIDSESSKKPRLFGGLSADF